VTFSWFGLPSRRRATPRPSSRPNADQPQDAVDRLLSLQRAAGNRAVTARLAVDAAPLVLRAPGGGSGPETVTVTITWKRSPPKTYLRTVVDAHPPDWAADVYAKPRGGTETKLGSGDGTLDVTLVKDTTYNLRIAFTAMEAPSDYYTNGSKKKWKAAAGTVKVTPGYNRWNQRFYEQSWTREGLDRTKTGKIARATMFGRSIQVNELVVPKVNAANAYFESAKLTDTEREEVKQSIVSMGGFAKRTTSSGAYSNHSTGCAVDINAFGSTWQNEHVKKDNAGHASIMSLVKQVVGDDADWKGYDPWLERDHDRILEASRRFNARFPPYLAGLLDRALGRRWRSDQLPVGGRADQEPSGIIDRLLHQLRDLTLESGLLVQIVTPELISKAAKRAKKSGESDLEKRLARVETHWSKIRAWVEGIVVYQREINGKDWAYASEYAQLADKPDIKGRLHGMVSLHPKLVECLREGGWSWLVDYRHNDQKDYMHFEDRDAQEALKA